MCELFAVSLAEPEPVNALLAEFFSHGDNHPHGWGLSLRTPFGIDLEKEPTSAARSTYLKDRLTEPIVTTDVLAHIRYATKGSVKRVNCHPFLGIDAVGNRWMLIHNGTLFDSEVVRPYLSKRQGETDSEAALLSLLDATRDTVGDLASAQGRRTHFHAIEHAIAALSVHNKVNLIFNDGIFTYVHTNFMKQSLYSLPYKSGFVFSTCPLSKESWVRIPLTQLLVFQKGKPIFVGKAHGAVYEETLSDTKHLYHEYAML